MRATEATFPLVPRHRLAGLSFGALRSARRGRGSDVAGSRPYRRGDDFHAIDWAASARLSLARGADEFVVRERYAEEAPRVVVVCDRRPAMSFFSAALPWLSKPAAISAATALIADSAVAARGFVGYLDYADGEPYWRPPRSERELAEMEERSRYRAPEDNLTRALAHLAEVRRQVPAGSFLFVLSDFLTSPSDETWTDVLERRWELVPVVIQDPVWEQSFPDVGEIVVPFADPASGRTRLVRLSAREALERRQANERRLDQLLTGFRTLRLEPVLLSSSDRDDVLRQFVAWSERLQDWRTRGQW